MGKPEPSATGDAAVGSHSSTPSHLGESAASISLGSSPFPTHHRAPSPHGHLFDRELANDDDDDDDLPPLYTDHEEFSNDAEGVFDPLMPRHPQHHRDDDDDERPFRQDDVHAYFVDARLDRDPDRLAGLVDRLSAVPPRPFVRMLGTHMERSGSGSDKNRETRRVTDFEIEIELTHLLYADIRSARAWRSVSTAGNFEKVRRGTVFATRAPGFGGSGGGAPEEGVPGLREWCRRYCASRARLRCFTVERRVQGYDWDLLRRRLEGLVRATNYRGRVDVAFPVRHSHVHVYSDVAVNRWRLTRWISMVFVFSLLFVFTWPYLLLATKRWETVRADWSLSEATAVPGRRKYASMSEEQWYAMWAGTVQRAMLERRRGTLDQGDLERTRAGQGGGGGQREAAGMEAMDAMGVVNRSFGWGGDTA
ncbi:hypothetical protein UVI_02031930 [Ustilaginoidea virens]|uniref:Uncharacterized protein n=1 Tax=Ustilaginoidea virens TaxID=1159556 RepID=A0A1B5KU40_USTVR|nr:hypothetical protein UVI_02031930 [Ustilaginoidea virens]